MDSFRTVYTEEPNVNASLFLDNVSDDILEISSFLTYGLTDLASSSNLFNIFCAIESSIVEYLKNASFSSGVNS